MERGRGHVRATSNRRAKVRMEVPRVREESVVMEDPERQREG